jgi:prepilin-type N-terminal cleavage/methylation domain-containing protein
MKNRKGFTLPEVLVVIAIMAIMTAVVLISQQNTRNQRYLEAGGRQFAAVVQELQNNTLTGKQISAGRTICGYGFRIADSPNNKTYDLYYNYVPDSAHSCSGEGETTAVPRGYNAEFSNLYGQNNSFGNNVSAAVSSLDGAYFSIPYANAYGGNGSVLPANFKITLSHVSVSQNYTICIYSGGRIEEPGINTSTCP